MANGERVTELRWITNIFDPEWIKTGPNPLSPAEEWFANGWLEGKVFGPPRASEWYTVEEYVQMHTVGVYVECGDEENESGSAG